MANNDKTKIEYVGDSRVPAKKHPNISPSYSEFPGKTEAFWPNFLLKEWMVAAVALMGYLILTVSQPAPLTDMADPTNTSFTPLPDWYFLFLYQLLKYPWASGTPWVLMGTVVLPGLMFGGLMLAPFLDRGPERRWTKRPVASGLMFLGVISVAFLTWEAMDGYKKMEASKAEAAAEAGEPGGDSGGAAAPPAAELDSDDPGAEIWAAQTSCVSCHGADMSGGGGPPLTDVGSRLSADEIKDVIVNGAGIMSAGMFDGTDEELDQLVEFLAEQK
ncbi:cytochrome C oxidase Cbb3 [Ammoniphilus oxalaticus]|uniref:Cytochrome C oxidase Cbb3 n=1 Tax=Ammoniphilus oxalaticus TaxID=66863 RepID=A0A419SN77_9BACL|nr:menaquinol-cytochrome c reductase cytochrome b/c subunit [Ammoniphilus oxalaticus]RKD25735.1 cytochrome C oxidase Cbb3 [Ammoniphilus oxalaticus]